jgi:chemotaxis methyl-accepting protein methylase
MVEQATHLHPELAHNARMAALPLNADDSLLEERFDLLLCSAVIMHLDTTSLSLAAAQMVRMTKPGGHLVVTHSS